jgi:hypothetical protein
VEVQGNSCIVSFSGIKKDDVRLKASLDKSKEGFRIYPKKESFVLVSAIENSIENLLVIAVDEVEKISVKIEDSFVTYSLEEFSANLGKGKLELKNNDISLKKLLNDVLNMIKNLKVTTPSGVSGTPLPPTLQEISNIETNIEKLFKG